MARRPYTLPEKVALAYTSLGSQRAVARDLGLSHQQVGRLLRAAQGIGPAEGGLAPDSRVLRRPEVVEAVEQGYRRHVERARAMARRDDIPFSPAVPIAYQRLPMIYTERREVVDPSTGEITQRDVPVLDERGRPVKVPGDRIGALFIGWVPQRIREEWVRSVQKTDRFVSASVSSLVNLKRYLKKGDQRLRGQPRTEKQKQFKRNMTRILREADHDKAARVFSTYTRLDAGFPAELVRDGLRAGVEKQAQALDEGAQGKLADQVLLQYRPRDNEDRAVMKARKARKAEQSGTAAGRGTSGKRAAAKAGRGSRKG
jgi:hypothetical protein